ncbi:MAG: YwaF family protein [Clostridia bacterium]|nr:YwaF family protein [Clostridia bacterium]
MNCIAYRLIILLVSALFGVTAYIFKRKNIPFDLIGKLTGAALFILTFVFSAVHKEAISIVIGLNRGPSPFGTDMPRTAFATVLIWLTYTAVLLIAFSRFTKKPALHYTTKLFALPVLVLDTLFLDTYSIANIGNNPSSDDLIYLPFIVAIIAIGLSLSVTDYILVSQPRPSLSDTALSVGIFAAAALVAIPPFVLQVLLGFRRYEGVIFSNFTQEHRIMLYLAFIIPIIAFHILKNLKEDNKRLCVLFYSLAISCSYFSYYSLSDWTSPANLPLGICSVVIILMPFALMTKNEWIFNCCLFLGVLTSFTDMLFPTVGQLNVTATESIRFWASSYFVFFVPVLCVALKIFRRPSVTGLLRALFAFSVYFLFTLCFNAVINNFATASDYLNFENNYILSAFPEFAKATKEVSFSFSIGETNLEFFPLYDLVVYVSYVLLIVIMWFMYKALFKSWDKAENRRLRERDYNKMKKELKSFLGTRSQDAPMYGDNSPKLVLRKFSKKYGNNKHYSVDHVSFAVKGGEIFGFLGPNGAGKSTIIKSIVGIQPITSGSIEVCGYDVSRQSIQAKLNTGFVPDHYALYENLTGREYINYIADLYDVDKKSRDEAIEKYVTRFQLHNSFDNPMKTYSHGMKQKIAIMAALVHNPKVWILDEPLTGLDPNSIYEVKECMKEHAAKGNIVFFSSHIIDVVEKICDKIAIIKHGRIRAVASMAKIEEHEIDLEELYLHVITADEDEEIINIGGNDILNVTDYEALSSTGAKTV